MKKVLSIILALAMVFTLAACAKKEAPAPAPAATTPAPAASTPAPAAPAPAPAPADAKSYTIKFGHGNAPEDFVSVAVQAWADNVKAATDGRITIEVYPASQLGDISTLMEMVSMGTLDMCLGDLSTMGSYLPKTDIFAMPYMWANWDHVSKVVDGEIGAKFFDELAAESNLRQLGVMWNGMRCLTTKTPIYGIADCKDIVMRSPNLEVYLNLFKTLGMNPVPIAWDEAFNALATGVADGIEDSCEVAYKYDFWMYCKYICKDNHICGLVGPTIREDLWKEMSADDQRLLQDLLDLQIEWERKQITDSEDYYYGLLEEKGMTVTDWKDRSELINAFEPQWGEFAKKNGCEDLLKQIIDLSK
jgi:tripartite ATP-independent transporter DctP family solute receptor